MKALKKFPIAVCRAILASAFWLVVRLIYSLKIHGVEHDTGKARTYLGMMHKRDIDFFILVPIIVLHRGWKALARDLHFALLGYGFKRGFLARSMGWQPGWLARLLRPLGVGHLMRWLGNYPKNWVV